MGGVLVVVSWFGDFSVIVCILVIGFVLFCCVVGFGLVVCLLLVVFLVIIGWCCCW